MLEKMFDRNQNILLTKNVEQTPSNMHATVVDVLTLLVQQNVYFAMFERVAGALSLSQFWSFLV